MVSFGGVWGVCGGIMKKMNNASNKISNKKL